MGGMARKLKRNKDKTKTTPKKRVLDKDQSTKLILDQQNILQEFLKTQSPESKDIQISIFKLNAASLYGIDPLAADTDNQLYKLLTGLESFELSKFQFHCVYDYQFVNKLITSEEHLAYRLNLFSEDIMDLMKYATSNLVTKIEFATPETVIRDFQHLCEDRFYGEQKVWNINAKFIGGIHNYPDDFKTHNDFDWINERINENYEEFEEYLNEVGGSESDRKELSAIKSKWTNECESIRSERV